MAKSETHHVHTQHRPGAGQEGTGGHHHASPIRSMPGMVTDPVCGMTVDPTSTRHRFDYEGQTFHFCSACCRDTFIAAPATYRGTPRAAPAAAPVPKNTLYTCPMHPQIRQIGPGTCPICGMAL